MIGRILIAAFLAAIALPVQAEVARVRSGDHPTYTRLVIELATPAEWKLGTVDGGYGFEVQREGVTYNLRDVFRLIGRKRLSDITYDADTGRLLLDVDCNCHIRAVDFDTSWVIIDITDGPGEDGSPFETALDEYPDEPEPAVRLVAQTERDDSTGARWITAPASTAPPVASAEPPAPASDRTPVPVFDPDAWQDEWLADIAPDIAAIPQDETQILNDPIRAQEDRLLRQVARAAAQGLLEPNLTERDRLEETMPQAASREPVVEDQAGPDPKPEEHIRLEAETSIDRDSGLGFAGQDVTPDGLRCLPDQFFAFSDWGGEGDPAELLTDRRLALVGEFDRPDEAAVLSLARLYLHLGFGAEAKATIKAFGTTSDEADLIGLLANLLDGEKDGLPGALAGQAACDGQVALWSVLAEGGPVADQPVNTRAVLATFSALPLHLRRHLGPGLAQGFLDAGDKDTAVSIRNAISRAPGPHGAGVGLLDAELALAEEDPDTPAKFEALLHEDDAVAPDAYARYLETELAAGHAPDGGAETAAALAFELSGTERGTELAELAVRAVLASGDFDAARREAIRLEQTGAGFDAALWRAFAGALATGAQDGEFLRQVFAARGPLARSDLSAETASALVTRLARLGFPEEALRYVPREGASDAARLAQAEALLTVGRPAEAVGVLVGLQDPDAERLRAEAFLALGDARAAAERFAATGDVDRSEQAAWIAGAWDLLEQSEDPALRDYAIAQAGEGTEALDLDPATADPGADQVASVEKPQGRVDQARATLAASQGTRGLVEDLLARN